LEVGLADGPQPEARARRCVRPRAYVAHAIGHASSELSDGLIADRGEERVTVGEMPVCGVRNDADHARDLAQHDRVRAARSRQLEAGLDERGPDGSTRSRPLTRRRIARSRLRCGPLLARWHVTMILVDNVHNW